MPVDPLFQLFEGLNEYEPSPDLHPRMVRRLLVERYRRSAFILATLLGLSLIVSAYHAIDRLIARDIHSLVQLAFTDFEFSRDYILDFTAIIGASFPVGAVSVFLVNVALSVYAVLFARNIARSLPPGNHTTGDETMWADHT